MSDMDLNITTVEKNMGYRPMKVVGEYGNIFGELETEIWIAFKLSESDFMVKGDFNGHVVYSLRRWGYQIGSKSQQPRWHILSDMNLNPGGDGDFKRHPNIVPVPYTEPS